MGSRLGGAKPQTLLAGRALIDYPVAASVAAGLAPLVVAKLDTELPRSLLETDARVLLDPPGEAHPLLGIATALEHAAGPVVAIAGDMPFVTAALLARLAALDGCVVLRDSDGRVQPLIGRYEPSALPILRAAIERGGSVRDAVGELGAVVEDAPEGAVLFDVDTPEDLAEAERLLAESEV